MCTWCFPSSILHACIPSLLGGRNKTVGDLCCCSRWWDDIDWAVGRVVGYDLPLQQISYHTPPPNVFTMEVYPLFDWSAHPQLPDTSSIGTQYSLLAHHSLTIGMDLESMIVACQHALHMMWWLMIAWLLLNSFPFWSLVDNITTLTLHWVTPQDLLWVRHVYKVTIVSLLNDLTLEKVIIPSLIIRGCYLWRRRWWWCVVSIIRLHWFRLEVTHSWWSITIITRPKVNSHDSISRWMGILIDPHHHSIPLLHYYYPFVHRKSIQQDLNTLIQRTTCPSSTTQRRSSTTAKARRWNNNRCRRSTTPCPPS